MLLGLTAWIIGFACYLLLAGQVSMTEIIAAIPSATAIAAFSLLLHRGAARRFSLRAPWLRILGRTSAALVGDTLRIGRTLLQVLWRRPQGAVGLATRQPFRPGGRDPRSAARRGLVTLATSVAPNGYVLDITPERDALLLHRLVPVPPQPDRDWPL